MPELPLSRRANRDSFPFSFANKNSFSAQTFGCRFETNRADGRTPRSEPPATAAILGLVSDEQGEQSGRMSPFFATPAASELVDLADRIARGDTVAENRLVLLYAERVRIMAINRTGDREASKEIADDVMMAAIQALRRDKVRDKERLGAFVHGIAVNVINNFLRTRGRRPAMGQLPDDLPASDGAELEESRNRLDWVLRGIAQLSPRDREVLQLAFVDGMSSKEVAQQMGLTQDVVRQRKCRALNHLKAHLGKPLEAAPDGGEERHQ